MDGTHHLHPIHVGLKKLSLPSVLFIVSKSRAPIDPTSTHGYKNVVPTTKVLSSQVESETSMQLQSQPSNNENYSTISKSIACPSTPPDIVHVWLTLGITMLRSGSGHYSPVLGRDDIQFGTSARVERTEGRDFDQLEEDERNDASRIDGDLGTSSIRWWKILVLHLLFAWNTRTYEFAGVSFSHFL